MFAKMQDTFQNTYAKNNGTILHFCLSLSISEKIIQLQKYLCGNLRATNEQHEIGKQF